MDELLIGHVAIGRFLHIHERMVGRLAKTAGLPAARVGGHRMTTREVLLKWVADRAAKEAARG